VQLLGILALSSGSDKGGDKGGGSWRQQMAVGGIQQSAKKGMTETVMPLWQWW
jgi:hypothetical protein